ncbi:MAG TPA: hypothetical protein VMR34_05020 [Candidatus Saccharimonadales bacterium]|nr:hypothetical protein [Candidatus Saccharimonadales bacterium]
MDRSGYEVIRSVIGNQDETRRVHPYPEEGKDVRYVRIDPRDKESPEGVLNTLDDSGLMARDEEFAVTDPHLPLLRYIGAIKTEESGSSMLFVDLNS